MINRTSTILLQAVILLIGIVVLAFLIRFPLTEGRAANLDLVGIYSDPFIWYGYAASIPFFIALYKGFKIVGYIGHQKLYSTETAAALKTIKYSAIALSILIVLAAIYIILSHPKDEDPAGFIAMCIVTTILSIVVSIVAGRFERRVEKGMDKTAQMI